MTVLSRICAVVLLGLALTGGGALPARADVLVSNLGRGATWTPPVSNGQPFPGEEEKGDSFDYAQLFTVGRGQGLIGYTIESVDIQSYLQFDSGLIVRMEIYSATGTGSSARPGNLLGTLTSPSFGTRGRQVLTFPAVNGAIDLTPGDYFLVLDVSPPQGRNKPRAFLAATPEDREDAGAKPGFSIANTHLYQPNVAGAKWLPNRVASSLLMRLNGKAVPVTNLSVKQIALSNSFVEAGDVVFQVSLDKTNRKNFEFQTCFSSSAASLGGTVYERLSDYPNFTKAVLDGDGCLEQTYPAGEAASSDRALYVFRPDGMDRPDKTVTTQIRLVAPRPFEIFVPSTANEVTATIRDGVPTLVRVFRTATSAISEGGSADFGIILGRELVAGEIVDVPLAIGGAGVTLEDWALAVKSGAGVALRDQQTARPIVRFAGAGAQSATLELSSLVDGLLEGGEVYGIAARTSTATGARRPLVQLDTNVSGGTAALADDIGFDLEVTDATREVTSLPYVATTQNPDGTYSEGSGGAAGIDLSVPAPLAADIPFRACFETSHPSLTRAVGFWPRGNQLDNGCFDAALSSSNNPINGNIVATIIVDLSADGADRPDEEVTLRVTDDPDRSRLAGVAPIDLTERFVIRDFEPTVVSLARTGAAAIAEGGATEFTVSLGRRLIAGEVIDVPLAIGGAGVTLEDWRLAAQAGQGRGVRLIDGDTATPVLRFAGEGAGLATLLLETVIDNVAEGGSEVITVALGSDGTGANGFDRAGLGTNVGGGADPDPALARSRFIVTVNDVVATQTVSVALPAVTGIARDASGVPVYPEAGGLVGRTMRFDLAVSPAPASDLEVCVGVAEAGASRLAPLDLDPRRVTVDSSGSAQVALSWRDTALDDADSAVTMRVLPPGSAGCAGAGAYLVAEDDAASAMARIRDDEATVVRVIAPERTGVVAAGQSVAFSVELERALVAGEVIDVPLPVGGTGITLADWSLRAPPRLGENRGVSLRDRASATPVLRFEGAGSRVAQLALEVLYAGRAARTLTVALGPDGTGVNGFDRAALGTDIGGGADPDTVTRGFSLQLGAALKQVRLLVPIGSDSDFTWPEDGAVTTFGLDVPAPLAADVPFRACFETSYPSFTRRVTDNDGFLQLDNDCYDGAISSSGFLRSGRRAIDFSLERTPDGADRPDEEITLRVTDDPDRARPAGVAPIDETGRFVIRDADPTVVSLARTGAATIDEGGCDGIHGAPGAGARCGRGGGGDTQFCLHGHPDEYPLQPAR